MLKLQQDGDGNQSFKMRLVHRDRGCAVCLAKGITEIYRFRDDSSYYNGSHIFPFALQDLVSFLLLQTSKLSLIFIKWDIRGYANIMTDPFTHIDAGNATRNRRDSHRINSLGNGILLCLFHHKCYDNFHFSIHPEVRDWVI